MCNFFTFIFVIWIFVLENTSIFDRREQNISLFNIWKLAFTNLNLKIINLAYLKIELPLGALNKHQERRLLLLDILIRLIFLIELEYYCVFCEKFTKTQKIFLFYGLFFKNLLLKYIFIVKKSLMQTL